jgi:CDP-glycerol glycerophosphotransferase (TagB/SpsB family)
MAKRIFISADHGLAIIYFLQSEVISTLLDAGVEVVVFTDDALMGKVRERFGKTGLTVEGLRLAAARKYEQQHFPSIQWWLHFLRRAGASNRINLEAVNGFIRQVEDEAHTKRRILFPLMKIFIALMRRSSTLRKWVTKAQNGFDPEIYKDLFEKYNPDLVVAATPGWRLDRYLLREAAGRGIKNASVIVGWDNSSSYSLPGAQVDWATCWSEIQKDEMVKGADWDPERVNIGGIPAYDGYIRGKWLVPKDEYFQLHGLDPDRKLISYASSFVSFSPNLQNIETLARMVASDRLTKPSQLLIRLHPTHFLDVPRYRGEREKIQALAAELENVHVVEPVSLGGEMGHYSGEDNPEKSSMMAYSDVMVTVYSTMVVEASVHGTPVVSLCIDAPKGWPDKFTLPLSKIGGWPTHQRYRDSMAGREATDEAALKKALNHYLENPEADQAARNAFLERECTYLDGSAGRRTAQFLLSLLNDDSDQ